MGKRRGTNSPENKLPDTKQVNDKIKEIAGRAEVLQVGPQALRHPARPSTRPGSRVTLLLEGETLPKVWQLAPDAEVKRAGWWARLDQLTLGDRVWVWFKINRQKEPLAVADARRRAERAGHPRPRRHAGSHATPRP